MTKLVSIDLETTGLDLEYHEVWEVGIVPLDSSRERIHYQFQPVDLNVAEPGALQVNQFYDRFEWIGDVRLARDMLTEGVIKDEDEGVEKPTGQKALTLASEACFQIAKALEGATLVGLNVGSFDGPFLGSLLRKYGHAVTWSHRSLELGSYAAGAWGAKIPLSGRAIADRLEASGIENRELHNAFSDALWNVDAYNFIREGRNAE